MTEYIYLASEQPLSTGSVTLNGLSKPTGNLLNRAFFFFISDFEGDPPGKSSYSNYLKTLNYRICSVRFLPSDNQSIETPSAIALLGYIRNHFKDIYTTKLYILSTLNGFESKPVPKTITRKLSGSSYKNLYYQGMKLLEIVRQHTCSDLSKKEYLFRYINFKKMKDKAFNILYLVEGPSFLFNLLIFTTL